MWHEHLLCHASQWPAGGTVRGLHGRGVRRRSRAYHLQSELRSDSRNPAARSENGEQHRALLRRHRTGRAGLGDPARPLGAPGGGRGGTELPQRSGVAGPAAQSVRRQDHRILSAQSGWEQQHCQRAHRAQRLRPALPGHEPLRPAVSGQPDRHGAGRGTAGDRDRRKAAVLTAGTADFSSTGRRYHSQARARLDSLLRAAGQVRCRAELCIGRHDLERRLQHRGPGDRRHARPGGLGDAR